MKRKHTQKYTNSNQTLRCQLFKVNISFFLYYFFVVLFFSSEFSFLFLSLSHFHAVRWGITTQKCERKLCKVARRTRKHLLATCCGDCLLYVYQSSLKLPNFIGNKKQRREKKSIFFFQKLKSNLAAIARESRRKRGERAFGDFFNWHPNIESATEKIGKMLRSCACFQRQRRGSSFEDSSSCRSSEIERGSEVSTSNGSLLKLITSRGWCRQWRKTGSTISMSKIERSKLNNI